MSANVRRRNTIAAVLVAAATLGGGVLSAPLLAGDAGSKGRRTAHAALVDAAGRSIGGVRFERRGRGRALQVTVSVRNLSPGFHGFHVHAVGRCDGPGFMTAGPHLAAAGAGHPAHAGDMPVLLVASDGRAQARFTTDRLSLAALRDADGSAVIVHALPDNYANIPTDRYEPDPDAMTLATGDSGPRTACGAVR